MQLENYRPRSKLVVRQTAVPRPRFPVIDAHNHLAEPFGGGWDKRPVAELLDVLDQAGVRHYVDLDGGWSERLLQEHLDHFKAAAPDRFTVFGGVDWAQWPEQGDEFPDWAAGRLYLQKAWGAQGLKIWKELGLQVLDPRGERVRVDDPRLDVIWHTPGELSLPVIIHVADPVAFFDPVDETNERWEELRQHPDWVFTSPPFPPFRSVVEALALADSSYVLSRAADTADATPPLGGVSYARSPDQRYIRGLFAGGTFCYQAQQILRDAGLKVFSNTPMDGTLAIEDVRQSQGHCLIDMGSEEFTNGRPHPMIDASLRRERIMREAADPSVGVLLLDFVLGYNASPDPVGDLLEAILQAQDTVRKRRGWLTVIASVCGTEQDQQKLETQVKALRGAGVMVLPTAAKAAEAARDWVVRLN